MREILTLMVDNTVTKYYIQFEKDRKRFHFQPTLKNKTAPIFTIRVQNNQLITEQDLQEYLAVQAKEKVKEILSNSVFDKL